MTESPALPVHIGPYRVTGRLGRGGMGEVLAGHDDRLDRPVALKRIRPGGKDPEKARRRFRHEARVVARLSHPAVVAVYDWVEEADDNWLVMEQIDGRSLDEVLAEGPLPWQQATGIARDVAAGLGAAHAAGLVHRDLKPANVMVMANSRSPAGSQPGSDHPTRIKILDFGIAKAVGVETAEGRPAELASTLTEAGQMVGTVASMSPEQALGWPVDHCSDLFSLGTLLYEMLSGVSPFAADSAMQTLTRICGARETPLRRLDSKIPEDLARLVTQLLEKEPARRPADAQAVVAELDRLIASRPAAVPPTAVPPTSATSSGTSQEPLERPQTAITPGLSGAEDTTLVGSPPGTSRSPAKTLEGSDTYAIRKVSLKWAGPLATVAMMVVIGTWVWSSRLGPSGREEPSTATLEPDVDQPEPELGSHELYQRGMKALERYDRKGNIDRAIDDFQRALAIDEEYAPALAGLAWGYWRDSLFGSLDAQRPQQAMAAARRAVELNEHLAVARVSLGMALLATGRGEEAAREFEKALQIEPGKADAHFGLARLLDAQGDLSQAEEHIRHAIAARPEGWYYHTWLGTLQHKSGRYEEAEVAFQHSRELAPNNIVVLRNLGGVFYQQGDLSAAANQFQQALQIQPSSTLYNNLGMIYFVQGLYPEALSAFKEAVETGGGSNNYLMWGNLGDAYRWTPDHERQAREAYSHAVRLLQLRLDATPQDLTLRTRRVLYLAKRGDCDQALTEVATGEALAADEDASAWFRLTVANEVCDRREAALKALDAALRAGYSITDVEADPELLGLRQDVRYHRLVLGLRADGGG